MPYGSQNLWEPNKGCPLSPTLLGLYVVGLKKHLLESAGTDAPGLRGVLALLLLYADDLMLMSTTVPT